MSLFSPRIYLASNSPRRRELLGQIGIPFERIACEIDETPLPGEAARPYVERLARAKETGYSQDLDHNKGEAMNLLTSQKSLRYPFQVNRDDNPRGAAWLRAVLAS